MKKFCTKCGREFNAIGREVICPSCKQAAAEDAKRAAVLKAKRASWTGESVPVRISGRASTVIRKYGEANNMTFAESLDELLKNTPFFTSIGVEWSAIVPYKSRRRDKATSTTEDVQKAKAAGKLQDAPQEVKAQEVTKAAKVANKNTTSTAAKKAIKMAAGKKVKA